eukprot:scaffold5308_cov70-Phaeocystis_antarctica.AAC.8
MPRSSRSTLRPKRPWASRMSTTVSSSSASLDVAAGPVVISPAAATGLDSWAEGAAAGRCTVSVIESPCVSLMRDRTLSRSIPEMGRPRSLTSGVAPTLSKRSPTDILSLSSNIPARGSASLGAILVMTTPAASTPTAKPKRDLESRRRVTCISPDTSARRGEWPRVAPSPTPCALATPCLLVRGGQQLLKATVISHLSHAEPGSHAAVAAELCAHRAARAVVRPAVAHAYAAVELLRLRGVALLVARAARLRE